MALIPKWTTGCEFNDLDTCGFNDVSGASIQETVVHHGSYALQLINAETGSYAHIAQAPLHITARSETYHHFYFRFESAPAGDQDNWFLKTLEGGDASVSLSIYGRKITAYDGEGNQIGQDATLLLWDTWYEIEVHLKAASTYGSSGDGVCEVKLDGTIIAEINSTTEDNILPIDGWYFCNAEKDSLTYFYFDDLISCDVSGDDMNSWIGDSRIEIKTVDSVGNYNDWLGNPDTGADNWKNVDENPPDGVTSRVTSPTEDDKQETYKIFGADYARAKRAVIIRILGDAGSPSSARTMVRYDGTDYTHEMFYTGGWHWKGTSELMNSPVYYDAPDASAWTNAKINALEVGADNYNYFTDYYGRMTWAGVEIIYDETTAEGPPVAANIKVISGVAWGNVKKVSGVAEASISAVSGVSAN